jgi:hypothetical protein
VSYRKVIEAIDNWESLTEAEILAAAKDPSHLLVDRQMWTLLGIAQIIGDANVEPLISFLQSIGLGWVVHQAGGSGLPIGDAEFNAKLLAISHPSCQAIAAVGRRMVSLCGLNKLPEVDAQIVAAWQAMKKERRQNELRKMSSSKHNANIAAIDAWDGNPDTEPQI